MRHFFTQAELTNAAVVVTTAFPSVLLGLLGVVWLVIGKLIIMALQFIRKTLEHASPSARSIFRSEESPAGKDERTSA